jgi:hypothetical protein
MYVLLDICPRLGLLMKEYHLYSKLYPIVQHYTIPSFPPGRRARSPSFPPERRRTMKNGKRRMMNLADRQMGMEMGMEG